MSITRFLFCILLASFWVVGCSARKSMPDPLAGFHWCSLSKLDANKAITDDYKNYIRTLSPEEQKFLGPISFYEHGTDQHAVKIEIGMNGIEWEHVLIYDKNNKRIKTIKYIVGRYMS